MNNKRRKSLFWARESIDKVIATITQAADDVREYWENVPENMQRSERAEAANESVDALDEIVCRMEELGEELEEIINR